MEKQKTAVELLNDNFSNLLDMFFNNEIPKKDFLTMKEIYYQQTNSVFEEQVIEFSKSCLDKALDLDIRSAYGNVEKYYEETFLLE